ncbi:hypothetical protein T265_08420 [Opisthorchis viverrini]|uniref:Apple domain-containing protein n=1 Tax=Opisthorchis viverrini TaxID=6198 RepID=A0A074Z9I0_OPIVI|nr:hypothetical protein T265_08420 [Opisthorchis viverrini]KER23768.1 hypothetical protein T265_08420 [Opisthorchis viverrini]
MESGRSRDIFVQFGGPIGLLWAAFFIVHGIATNLYSPNIYNAQVYSSSVALGTKPEYAVDADFYEPAPTCFSTDDQLPDTQGFHWILLDLGTIIRNIREVRVVTDVKAHEKDNLVEVEAFVVTGLDNSKQDLSQTEPPSMKPSLSWSSPSFQYCSSSNDSEIRGQTATIRCAEPLSGRWLAIRRKNTLQVCLVSVYVERAFEDCFRVLPNLSVMDYRGSVFRYVRHVSEQDCRTACIKAPNCDAMLFTKQRFSGTCQLVQSFQVTNENESGALETDILSCASENCLLIINDCHEGILKKLEPVARFSEPDQDNQLVQDWRVQAEKFTRNKGKSNAQTTYLLSVYFDGRLECSEWNCGLIYVYSVDAEGTETLCTFINTEHITLLENTRLRCDYSTNSPRNTTLIRLKWKAPNQDEDAGHLQIKLVHGHIRISMSEPLNGIHLLTTSAPIVRKTAKIDTTTKPPLLPLNVEGLILEDSTGSPKQYSEEFHSTEEDEDMFTSLSQTGDAEMPKPEHNFDDPPIGFYPQSTTSEPKTTVNDPRQWNDFRHRRNETQFDQPQTESQQKSPTNENDDKRVKVLHYRGASRSVDARLPANKVDDNSMAHSRERLSLLILLAILVTAHYAFDAIVQNVFCRV